MKVDVNKMECCMVRAGVYSVSDLAKKVGVSQQTVYAIKQRGTCRMQTAAAIARALGVDVTAIMEEGDK